MVEQGMDVAPTGAQAPMPAGPAPADAFQQARLIQEQLRRRRN